MLPPTVKQFFFKLLISIFVHDYKNVLRQYRQAYTTQRQMEQYLRVITPEDLYDKELVRICTAPQKLDTKLLGCFL